MHAYTHIVCVHVCVHVCVRVVCMPMYVCCMCPCLLCVVHTHKWIIQLHKGDDDSQKAMEWAQHILLDENGMILPKSARPRITNVWANA